MLKFKCFSIRGYPFTFKIVHSKRIVAPDHYSSHSFLTRSCSSLSYQKIPDITNGTSSNPLLEPSDTFIYRHIGTKPKQQEEMLYTIGCDSMDEFLEQTIPSSIRSNTVLKEMHKLSQSEYHTLQYLHQVAKKNQVFKSYIGMGYYNCIMPEVIRRNVFEDPAWYSPYSPYQAEISQGRLESLLNFQTLVTELTGMDIANASLLDEGSAAAEGMLMAFRNSGGNKNAFFVSQSVHPQIVAVVKTRAAPLNIEIIIGRYNEIEHDQCASFFGALIQYPDTEGNLHDFSDFSKKMHAKKGLVVVASDPLALCIVKPPIELGADVVVGSMQRFGIPMFYGGPHAAFFATKWNYARRIPGRLVGVSTDASEDRALRLALQTREQHIRKEKATSNICTAQALLANIAAMYAVYHGRHGLQGIARRVQALTCLLREGLVKLGFRISNSDNFFGAISFKTNPFTANDILEYAYRYHLNLRHVSSDTVGIALDETTTTADVKKLLDVFSQLKNDSGADLELDLHNCDGNVTLFFQRRDCFLQQQIFNEIRSETEMLRYIRSLANKDLGLQHSMIALGSCTMKLNPASALRPVLWPEFCDIHPFAPLSQVSGYLELLKSFSNYLCAITGLDCAFLQPNSGATGELAGLLVIKRYYASRGEAHRNICLIPDSAHGTNFASAVLAGLKIVPIASDSNGQVDAAKFEEMAFKHRNNLCVAMITYPSTKGVFECSINRLCNIIHENGGNVYMDGANMNAQLGLTSPGHIGADVCHLNLHKTFAIPHGGGGPGVGPICLRKHLVSFLPDSICQLNLSTQDDDPLAVSAAPFGSAGILIISYMFIRMLGSSGLRQCAESAILNANYIMERLRHEYKIRYVGEQGRCAHEFIIDLSQFRKTCGIAEVDIAKRLMDYGFHAPTMSWPIPSALMIEPTESESKDELDRFCNALLNIRKEIGNIENGIWPIDNNPLKRAPHTMKDVCDDNWDRPYSRQAAAFPVDWIHKKGKFWPAVGRIDNARGDNNLFCGCGPVSDYINQK